MATCLQDYCTGHALPLPPYPYQGNFPTGVGSMIHDENIEDLRVSIDQERARRGVVPTNYPYTPTPIYGSQEGANPESGNPATNAWIYGQNPDNQNEAMRELKTAINQIRAGMVTISIVDGQPVTWGQIWQIRNSIDILRAECLCFGDCGPNVTCTCYGQCTCDYDYTPPCNDSSCSGDTGN